VWEACGIKGHQQGETHMKMIQVHKLLAQLINSGMTISKAKTELFNTKGIKVRQIVDALKVYE
jgi:hypothetical protein